ncbi:MAG: DUF2339 domain-containing protein, partial [Luteolibacter sp.]
GILGRRQNATAGGVNIGQGLAVATFAIVLKLDGHHLALVLGFESLALSVAALKYRGKSESVFSFLCGLGAAGVILTDHETMRYLTGKETMPIWSMALTALLVAAASVVSTKSSDKNSEFGKIIRIFAGLLFAASALIASHLCLFRLESPSSLLTAIFLSGALSFGSLKLDPHRRQPEIAAASLWFLGLAVFLGFGKIAIWPLALASAVSLAGVWLWHRQEKVGDDPRDLAANPGLPAYAFSFAVPFFLWLISADMSGNSVLGFNQLAAFLLVPVAIVLRCPRLVQTAALYSLIALAYLLFPPREGAAITFVSSFLAVVAAVVLHSPWGKRLGDAKLHDASSIFRISAFVSYCVAWHAFAPGAWTDFLAITSIALTAVSVVMKRKMFVECLGLIAIALIGLAFETLTTPWVRIEEAGTWRGISVIAALLALTLTYRQRPALIDDPVKRKSAIAVLAGITCFVTAVWATQMLVWRFGWKPSAVLWTVLGFAFVSAGLWQRLHILRVGGFILLVISFGKLFAVDVWDFTTFMRVVSFIVLGTALILLGLFYNKFAEAIKVLLDDERGAKE